MAKLSGRAARRSEDSNYLLGGNLCNAFAVGAVGSDEDFFMLGAPPRRESNYPLISGNFLDAKGNVLFKLEQNTLVENPGRCVKIFSDRIGYEIRDAEGLPVLTVSTRFGRLPEQSAECWVTAIDGNFHDRNKNLVVRANGEDGFIETSVGCLLGFDGDNFETCEGSTDENTNLAGICLLNHGQLFQPLYGTLENQTINLEGKALMPGALIQNCVVTVANGKFALLGGEILGNQLNLQDEAMRVAMIMGISPTLSSEHD